MMLLQIIVAFVFGALFGFGTYVAKKRLTGKPVGVAGIVAVSFAIAILWGVWR